MGGVMIRFILDEATKRLRVQITTEAEMRRLQADADKRGLSIQEMPEQDLAAHAAKMKAEGRL
jgi:hypothetical protein